MIKYLAFIVLSFISVLRVQSQNLVVVNGRVLDEQNNGVDLATVSLQRKSDSLYVKSDFSDIDGSFQLSKIPIGDYFIQVNLMGFETYKKSLLVDGKTNEIQVPNIVLKTAINQLGEVNVVAKVPYIERKIDRTVVNVDALIANEGSDALEALERAPGISLDNEGSILLKGRSGVAVFINDKPSYLSGSELESYLKSLPAGTVKQIEIMTNPPAKYDAAGNAGVINIVLKKNKIQGINGNVALGYRQGKLSASNNSFNLNYNRNKVGLSANVAGGMWSGYQDLNINRHYKDAEGALQSSFAQNSYSPREGRYLNAKFGLDYYLTDKSTLGVSYKVNNSPSERNIDNNALVTNPDGSLIQRVVADNLTNSSFSSNLYNAYFNHKIDSLGSEISVDADYVTYKSGAEQIFKNFIYNTNGDLTFQDQIDGDIPSQISIYALKTDYSKPLKSGAKIDAGLKTAFTETDNEAKYANTIEGVTTPDYGLSNRFLYDELINAGYLNYSHEVGRVSFQAGLRVESTTMKGHQLGNIENPDTSFTRNYTNAFPTFYASWKMDSVANNVLTFSYGRRINRPYFQDLNPFISPLDKFTFYAGNPDLLPTFSHNFSLAHSFKSLFTTTLNYSKTLDGINETLEIREGIYYSRPGNIANNETVSVSLEGSVPVTKWYSVNGYMEWAYRKFNSQLYTTQLQSKGGSFYGSITNSLKFKNGWSADVTAMYRSDMVYAQLELKGFGQIGMGLKKTLFNGAGTLRLTVSDVFKTRIGDGIINNLAQTDADWNSTFDSRRVGIAFSWRFGKNTLKKPKYNSNGSRDEQNRVRG